MRARLIKRAAIAAAQSEVRRYFTEAGHGLSVMWLVRKDYTIARLTGKLSADGRYFVPSCGIYPALLVNTQVFKSSAKAKAKAEKLRTFAEKRFQFE